MLKINGGVSQENKLYSKEQIEEQVWFQEKYFEYEIECAEE